MRRWHQEQTIMFRRWKTEMELHGYDWRNPPTDPKACHCAKGIGSMRKRKPYDCGNPRCACCHFDKWNPKARHTKKQAAINDQLH